MTNDLFWWLQRFDELQSWVFWSPEFRKLLELSESERQIEGAGSGIAGVFEPDALIQEVAGSGFEELFVNEVGLLVYTVGNPILWFGALREPGSDRELLYAHLEG